MSVNRSKTLVAIRGAVVMMSGEYEKRQDGMRLSDLIDQGTTRERGPNRLRVPVETQYRRRVYISQGKPGRSPAKRGEGAADILLQDMDIVQIPSQLCHIPMNISFRRVQARVRLPGPYDFDPAGVLRVQDAILISGGLTAGSFRLRIYPAKVRQRNPKRADYIVFNPKGCP